MTKEKDARDKKRDARIERIREKTEEMYARIVHESARELAASRDMRRATVVVGMIIAEYPLECLGAYLAANLSQMAMAIETGRPLSGSFVSDRGIVEAAGGMPFGNEPPTETMVPPVFDGVDTDPAPPTDDQEPA